MGSETAPATGAENTGSAEATPETTPAEAPASQAQKTTDAARPEGQESAQATADKAAPPAIEVKLPEGVTPDPKLMEALQGAAKDSASAQALADAWLAHQQAQDAAAKENWTATQQKWADQLKADPDVGGARYDASVIAAEKAMTRYADADLRQLLTDTGLRNHPSMFRMLVKAGQALSEDSIRDTTGNPPPSSGNDFRSLYSNSPDLK